MPATPSAQATAAWSLAGLEAHTAAGRIDLAAPELGLTTAGGDRLLGLDLRTSRPAIRPVDHWVRGDDLVAVYEPADPRRLRATAMWRSAAAERTSWELVVSAQTSLVESDSSLAVTCDLAEGEVSWGRIHPGGVAWTPLAKRAPAVATCVPAAAICVIVRRVADAAVVAVHPADARRIAVDREAGRVRVTCWLFSTAVEKGVLLRSRVLAGVAATGDPHWAEAAVARFAASPAPLTT